MKEEIFAVILAIIVIVVVSYGLVYSTHKECEVLSIQTGLPTKLVTTQGCFIQIGDKWILSTDTAGIINETEQR